MNGSKSWLSSRLLCLLTAVFLTTSSFAVTPDRIAGALANGSSVTLRGNVQRNALPKFDQGLADSSLRFGSIMMVTVPTASQRADLSRLLEEQQDRKSPNYHKWLTPEQWADRFGLSPSDVTKVTAWLKTQGFQNVQVARGRNWFMFSGTAAQVQSAFGTEIHRYKVDGEAHVANATSPRIPAALSGIVVGIRGLDDFFLKPRTIKRINPDYYSSSLQAEYLAPGDIATIYDLNTLYTNGFDGTGQKLAVIGQTDVYLSDLTDYRTGFGLSALSCTTTAAAPNDVISSCSDPHFTYVLVGSTDPLSPRSQDLAEADLDIEISGAVARGANIVYVNAPVSYNGNTIVSGGAWVSWYYAVDQNVAPVITMSYGTCEFFDTNILTSSGAAGADELELQKANSEGITFLNSSGDAGATECDNPMNNNPGQEAEGGIAMAYPASSPEVTAVGGTSITLANLSSTYFGTTNGTDGGSALSYIPEQAWNDDEEIAAYCTANPTNVFCTQGGSSAVPGWVDITNTQTAQTDVGMLASGGGPSNCAELTPGGNQCVAGFPQPSYQANLSLSGQTAVRFIPDVAFLASPDFPGYIICTEQSVIGDGNPGSTCGTGGASGITSALALPFPPIFGGTSVSTPLFAGIVTIMNQYSGSSGQGNINPTLYTMAATPSNHVFHAAVTTGDALDNDTHCAAGTGQIPCPNSGVAGFAVSDADATTGYNLVTGLGSIDANNLATALGSGSTNQSFTLAPQNPSYTVSQGQGLTVTVVLTPVNGFNSAVTYTCTDPASESTCTGPTGGQTTTSISFQITTTAATTELRRPMDRGARIVYAALLPGLLGIVFTFGSRKRSLQGVRMLGLILVLGCSTMWLGSCGGSSSSNKNPGTPKQTYTFNVSGTTGGNNAITGQTSFQVTVQ
jgi:subtilase family serine protease